jgi:hypothetical protein
MDDGACHGRLTPGEAVFLVADDLADAVQWPELE